MSENGPLRVEGEPESGPDAAGGGAALEELFQVLCHRRRRQLLASLRDAGAAVAVEELAGRIAAAEAAAGERIAASERRRIETALYHVHLPKLVDAGLVAWADDSRSAVAATDAGRRLPATLSWLPSKAGDPA